MRGGAMAITSGKKKPKKTNTPTESQDQIALFEWAEYIPELKLMHHIPNGGSRTASEGARFKREGVKAGVSDICLPLPRGEYHGLYIELKAVNGRKATTAQFDFLRDVKAVGYYGAVCYGFDEAREAIEKYLKMGEFE